MPVRTQGYCGVGRGLSGLHWVWFNGRGPHLEWTQEPQASSPFLTRIPWSLQSRHRRVTPSLLLRKWTFVCLSSCLQGDSPLVEFSLGPAGFSGRCTRVSVPLRLVPSSTGFPSKRCAGIGFFSRVDREIGVFRHVAPPTRLCLELPHETRLILRCARKVGNPLQTEKGSRPSCRNQERRRGQMKWCREPRCSP